MVHNVIMEYSQTDLDAINTAIAAHGGGTKAISITEPDGRNTTFSNTPLPQLLALRTQIMRDLAPKPGYHHTIAVDGEPR